MIHAIAILLLIWPAYANLHNKHFVLIGLFALQCSIQPFFSSGDPNTNYAIIIITSVLYATYTMAEGVNKYWYWLSGITLLAAFISFIESLLFNSNISNASFRYVFNIDRWSIMAITVVQTLLIIMATDGYRRELGSFLSHIKADWFKLDGILRRAISCKSSEDEVGP